MLGAATKKHKHNARRRTTKRAAHCSPIVEGKTQSYSCYTPEILAKLREKWNSRHADKPITTHDPHEIWQQLNQNLQKVCDEEICWLKQDFAAPVQKEIEKIAFVPAAPPEWKKNPTTWLSSLDISNSMKQYEQKYKCFKFIGPSPIDFDSRYSNSTECVWDELCHFSLKKYANAGVFKIGVIFNLDKHTEPGSHWVSFFVNIKRKIIFYFNSTGEQIVPEISQLRDRIIEQGRAMGIRFHFFQNTKEHQHTNTECGMYSLFFIISMLRDAKSVNFFKKGKILDRQMMQFRKIYFRGGGGSTPKLM
jgi:hypothetical protein